MKAVLKICFHQRKRPFLSSSPLRQVLPGATTLCFRCTTITLNMLSRGRGRGLIGHVVLCAFKSIASVSVNMQAETGLHYWPQTNTAHTYTHTHRGIAGLTHTHVTMAEK